ncbi:MAG: hypothetical protein GY719_27750 [bacterium]|nr:hypothetical protein [bacterium]
MDRNPPTSALCLTVLTMAILSPHAGEVFGDPGEIESDTELSARVVPMEPLPPPVPAPAPIPTKLASLHRIVPLEPLRPAPEIAAAVVEATVRDWALAWSEQRVEDYLSFYGDGFQPSGRSSRSQWENLRAKRVSAPAFIRVTLGSLKSSVTSPDRAWVEFVQSYDSSSYRDVVVKLLDLARDGEDWKIVAETALSEAGSLSMPGNSSPAPGPAAKHRASPVGTRPRP